MYSPQRIVCTALASPLRIEVEFLCGNWAAVKLLQRHNRVLRCIKLMPTSLKAKLKSVQSVFSGTGRKPPRVQSPVRKRLLQLLMFSGGFHTYLLFSLIPGCRKTVTVLRMNLWPREGH